MWKNFIQECMAQEIFIVAQGYSAEFVMKWLQDFNSVFLQRVKAVAFIDTPNIKLENLNSYTKDFIENRIVRFVAVQTKPNEEVPATGKLLLDPSLQQMYPTVSSGSKRT